MGCARSRNRSQIVAPHSIGKSNINYKTNTRLQVKTKDATGKQIGIKSIFLELTRPLLHSSDSITHPLVSHISRCVLPGIDPHSENEKICQDTCLYLQNNSKILLALFDGHGREGEKVVALCSTIVESFFRENSERYTENPADFLESLCSACNTNVKKEGNGIDSNNSGR